MLKRQRPSSPPPTPLLLSDRPLDDKLSRNIKRRRVQPPVLDGPARESTHSAFGNYFNDNEEEQDQDQEDDFTVDLPQPDKASSHTESITAHVHAQYKATNEMLHGLHDLNHNRLASHYSNHPRNPSSTKDSASQDECHTIQQHYQESNKFLGSLFLARKRAQGDSSHSP